jgi:hypothetical protein
MKPVTATPGITELIGPDFRMPHCEECERMAPFPPTTDAPLLEARAHTVEGECSICTTPFKALQMVSWCSNCKQPFHSRCLMRWLLRSSNCPMCRAEIPMTGELLYLERQEGNHDFREQGIYDRGVGGVVNYIGRGVYRGVRWTFYTFLALMCFANVAERAYPDIWAVPAGQPPPEL